MLGRGRGGGCYGMRPPHAPPPAASCSTELLGFPLAFAAELIRDRPDAADGELQDALVARLGADR